MYEAGELGLGKFNIPLLFYTYPITHLTWSGQCQYMFHTHMLTHLGRNPRQLTRPAQSCLSVLKRPQEGLNQLTFQFGSVMVGPYDHLKSKLRPCYHMIPSGAPEVIVQLCKCKTFVEVKCRL